MLGKLSELTIFFIKKVLFNIRFCLHNQSYTSRDMYREVWKAAYTLQSVSTFEFFFHDLKKDSHSELVVWTSNGAAAIALGKV